MLSARPATNKPAGTKCRFSRMDVIRPLRFHVLHDDDGRLEAAIETDWTTFPTRTQKSYCTIRRTERGGW